MTTLEYYEGLAAAKRAMSVPESFRREPKVCPYRITLKKKGAGKGYKEIVTLKSDVDYLRELSEVEPKRYALELCRIEMAELHEMIRICGESNRKQTIRDYRGKIASIRKDYGLTYDEVAEFYKVGA